MAPFRRLGSRGVEGRRVAWQRCAAYTALEGRVGGQVSGLRCHRQEPFFGVVPPPVPATPQRGSELGTGVSLSSSGSVIGPAAGANNAAVRSEGDDAGQENPPVGLVLPTKPGANKKQALGVEKATSGGGGEGAGGIEGERTGEGFRSGYWPKEIITAIASVDWKGARVHRRFLQLRSGR